MKSNYRRLWSGFWQSVDSKRPSVEIYAALYVAAYVSLVVASVVLRYSPSLSFRLLIVYL